MFGGLAFMLRGHMCVGILRETLIARFGWATGVILHVSATGKSCDRNR